MSAIGRLVVELPDLIPTKETRVSVLLPKSYTCTSSTPGRSAAVALALMETFLPRQGSPTDHWLKWSQQSSQIARRYLSSVCMLAEPAISSCSQYQPEASRTWMWNSSSFPDDTLLAAVIRSLRSTQLPRCRAIPLRVSARPQYVQAPFVCIVCFLLSSMPRRHFGEATAMSLAAQNALRIYNSSMNSFNGEAGLTEDRPERRSGDLLVIGYGQAAKRRCGLP
jgi:hypothetical protein